MRNPDDDLHAKIDYLCYDGDSLLGRDWRYQSPVATLLPSKKWWWPEYFKYKDKNERYYAKELNIPEGYIIVSNDFFRPSSVYEEARMININQHQVAIPMKWYFRMKDMDLHQQWGVLRMNVMWLPQKVKKADNLYKAMEVACQYGVEEELKSCFYDLKIENPDEYQRRILILRDKELACKADIDACQKNMNDLKREKEWKPDYETLHKRFLRSQWAYEMKFTEYLEKYGNLTQTGVCLVLKASVKGSLINRIVELSDQMMILQRDLQAARLARQFEESRFSFY